MGAHHARADAGECSERPDYNPKLDMRHMQRHGWTAPYTCRPVASTKDVDIEHIVVWAEARRSGYGRSATCEPTPEKRQGRGKLSAAAQPMLVRRPRVAGQAQVRLTIGRC